MGFIKLSDDLPNWAWYGDNNTLSVYIRLLIGAVWRETEYQNTTLQRGQIATTLPKIAKENGITERQARTILDRLKATGRVSVKTTSKFSIITLNNYDCAFENVSQSDRQMSGERQTACQSNVRPTLFNTDIQNTEEQNTRASGAVSNVLETAVREYNENCKSLEPLTGELSYHQGRLVVEAFKELHGVSFAEYFRRVEASDYLTGRTSRGYKTNFNWLIRPENVAKVLSGKYDRNFESGAVTTSPAKKDYDEPLWDD
mgnify:FL=1